MSTKDILGQCFYFICQPQAINMPVTFELLDKDGNKLKKAGGRTSAYTYLFGLKEPLEKVALVRANYRPERYRVVLHLPYIPGLPERNAVIENLFDVRVPYASFEHPVNIQQFLQKVLQLKNFKISGKIPDNNIKNMLFPMEFKDVTIRDIAKFYSKGGTLNIDTENDLLELIYPLPLLTKLNQIFQKISHNYEK